MKGLSCSVILSFTSSTVMEVIGMWDTCQDHWAIGQKFRGIALHTA